MKRHLFAACFRAALDCPCSEPERRFLMAQALACEPGQGATIPGFPEDS